MTGWRKKKMMSEVRWLGPYAPEDRHCDSVTMNHLIELQKKLSEAERQRENALETCMAMRKEILILQKRLEKYGDYTHDDDRNC